MIARVAPAILFGGLAEITRAVCSLCAGLRLAAVYKIERPMCAARALSNTQYGSVVSRGICIMLQPRKVAQCALDSLPLRFLQTAYCDEFYHLRTSFGRCPGG